MVSFFFFKFTLNQIEKIEKITVKQNNEIIITENVQIIQEEYVKYQNKI